MAEKDTSLCLVGMLITWSELASAPWIAIGFSVRCGGLNRINMAKPLSAYLPTLPFGKFKILPRIPELRALEGRHVATLTAYAEVPRWFSNLCSALDWDCQKIIVCKKSPDGTSIFKALRKLVSEERLQKLQNIIDVKEFPLRLTCRYKTILRCSITKHFKSCYSPNGLYREKPFEMISRHPNVAIACSYDRAGTIIARCFVMWVKPDTFAFGLPYSPLANSMVKPAEGFNEIKNIPTPFDS